MPKPPWKPWHEVVALREDLKSGELSLQMFAADLYEVIMQRGKQPVYEDPQSFFSLTFPTHNLRNLVRDAALRLAGAYRSGSRFGLLAVQEVFGLLDQQREIVADDLPDAGMIEQIVTVDQQVSEGDDLSVVADAACRRGIEAIEADHGFADDFEVAFHGLAQEAVCLIVAQGASGGALPYEGCRITDVFQQFRTLRMHTAVSA